MKIAGIIPARYASSRFPGKPLADIKGKTMIHRVYEQCIKCTLLEKVIIATDDERIFDEIEGFGGMAMMTSTRHESGTERCGEVVETLERQGDVFDAIINIQGDEPFIDPDQITKVAIQLKNENVGIATLVKKITNRKELFDPNVVKVVLDKDGMALYFSRATIPYLRGFEQVKWKNQHSYLKHVGIYGYKTETLKKITTLPKGKLEVAEMLEQLRWIENGYSIFAEETELESIAIDSEEDLSKILNV
ncbi:MAG: 3-deoxy-manno-octulosonate cytidylyltransferase [Bacteroidetes bacterium 4572_114]|nr:MAG: 3-deoxy-manno-octulosonate cytidylyltransferase [Bacteroidetes bacterium 4572_114]